MAHDSARGGTVREHDEQRRDGPGTFERHTDAPAAEHPDGVDETLERVGTHPLGTAAGAAGGAVLGAAAGIAAGPVGSLAGAVAGAIVGGMGGSGSVATNSVGPVDGDAAEKHTVEAEAERLRRDGEAQNRSVEGAPTAGRSER